MTYPVDGLRVFTVTLTWVLEVQVIAPDARIAAEAAESETSAHDVDFPAVDVGAEYGAEELHPEEEYINALPGDAGPPRTKATGAAWCAWIEEQREAERRALDGMTEGQRARRFDDATLPLAFDRPRARKRRAKGGAAT